MDILHTEKSGVDFAIPVWSCSATVFRNREFLVSNAVSQLLTGSIRTVIIKLYLQETCMMLQEGLVGIAKLIVVSSQDNVIPMSFQIL